MIPLRDANPTRRAPVITLALVAACSIAFAWELGVQASGGDAALDDLITTWGTVPAHVSADLAAGRWLTPATAGLVTSVFLHGGWLHLLGNMLFLWIFGNNIEDRLGRVPYLLFYLAGGIAASLAQVAIDAARDLVRTEYGAEFLPERPRTYTSKVKNAQEAHEAIRPAGHPFRLPESLRNELTPDQFAQVIKSDIQRYAKLAKTVGMSVD